ncbi:hypothetical protein EAI_05345 [Harpegnathos saltator]|uniref:Uncharacterized protein n=1 Tax=Harpegnathos saltator TaxID=610380 RepID=E2BA68_HARSA|nr:hypothetical protein EAI_05345 [Harpegnathos saltator]
MTTTTTNTTPPPPPTPHHHHHHHHYYHTTTATITTTPSQLYLQVDDYIGHCKRDARLVTASPGACVFLQATPHYSA